MSGTSPYGHCQTCGLVHTLRDDPLYCVMILKDEVARLRAAHAKEVPMSQCSLCGPGADPCYELSDCRDNIHAERERLRSRIAALESVLAAERARGERLREALGGAVAWYDRNRNHLCMQVTTYVDLFDRLRAALSDTGEAEEKEPTP